MKPWPLPLPRPGISQAVRDHMTKPTSLAQGRVAHLIEWKGWPKPAAPSLAAHSQFSSYCNLTEGEKEARFAAGTDFFDLLTSRPAECLIFRLKCYSRHTYRIISCNFFFVCVGTCILSSGFLSPSVMHLMP